MSFSSCFRYSSRHDRSFCSYFLLITKTSQSSQVDQDLKYQTFNQKAFIASQTSHVGEAAAGTPSLTARASTASLLPHIIRHQSSNIHSTLFHACGERRHRYTIHAPKTRLGSRVRFANMCVLRLYIPISMQKCTIRSDHPPSIPSMCIPRSQRSVKAASLVQSKSLSSRVNRRPRRRVFRRSESHGRVCIGTT